MRGKRKNNSQEKRMSSIAHRLHRAWIGTKLAGAIGWDVLLFFLLFAGWLADREVVATGSVLFSRVRTLRYQSAPAWDLIYYVKDETGKTLLRLPLRQGLRVIALVTLAVLALQLFGSLLSYFREEKKIRDILAPINEIALKVDELSRMSFSEDKYQQIEEAIDRLQPEETATLSFGDKDLQGIEAAMNNLLLRMREAYLQQARFVDDASHELRTPIAVIQGYANMLTRWGREDEKVLDESITAIKNESGHMQHLVDQLLFLARGDSGRTTLSIRQISLNELMREVYEESFMIDETHPYRCRLPEEEITVSADYGLLKQAVRILTDNAAKYTEQGDEIFLSIGKDGAFPYLQVEDAGIGMAETDVEHMFERFYRADDARSYQGTGLGLSIAKWIVDKHGGHFEILSRTGLGTRIRVILPGNGRENT